MNWKKVLLRTLGVIVILYLGLVIYRIPAVAEKKRTEAAVARIHAQKLTLDTVMGKNLPPSPDQVRNDSTIEGIDANANGIRDDVELAIFKKYPNSPKQRAPELQYAMALQREFTEVFNSETLVAVMQEQGRGYLCISEDKNIEQVENLIFNTEKRKQWREEIYKKYMTSFKLSNEQKCDIAPSSL